MTWAVQPAACVPAVSRIPNLNLSASVVCLCVNLFPRRFPVRLWTPLPGLLVNILGYNIGDEDKLLRANFKKRSILVKKNHEENLTSFIEGHARKNKRVCFAFNKTSIHAVLFKFTSSATVGLVNLIALIYLVLGLKEKSNNLSARLLKLIIIYCINEPRSAISLAARCVLKKP